MLITLSFPSCEIHVHHCMPVMESRPQSPRLRFDHPRQGPRPGLLRPRPPLPRPRPLRIRNQESDLDPIFNKNPVGVGRHFAILRTIIFLVTIYESKIVTKKMIVLKMAKWKLRYRWSWQIALSKTETLRAQDGDLESTRPSARFPGPRPRWDWDQQKLVSRPVSSLETSITVLFILTTFDSAQLMIFYHSRLAVEPTCTIESGIQVFTENV